MMSAPRMSAARKRLLATDEQDLPGLLVSYIRSNDKEKNDLAAQAFIRIGAAGLSVLVSEVVNNRKGRDHRIRVIDIIEQVNAPLSPGDFFSLMSAMGSGDLVVRQRIAQLLVQLRQRSPDHDPSTFDGSGDRTGVPQQSVSGEQ